MFRRESAVEYFKQLVDGALARQRLVDIDYDVSIGGMAYTALSRYPADTFSPIFAELAGKFVGFVDVLSEIGKRTACTSNADLLRLYERWLKTGSPRSRRLLLQCCVVPNASARTSRIH